MNPSYPDGLLFSDPLDQDKNNKYDLELLEDSNQIKPIISPWK